MLKDENGVQIEVGDTIVTASTGRALRVVKVHKVTDKSAGTYVKPAKNPDGSIKDRCRDYKGHPRVEWWLGCHCVVIKKVNNPNFEIEGQDYESEYVGN